MLRDNIPWVINPNETPLIENPTDYAAITLAIVAIKSDIPHTCITITI